jgi:hypothetical protein
MKNIHIIPTDKPSRLVLSNNNILTVIEESNYNFSHIKSVNIYITSDEFIEEEDFGLNISTKNIIQYDGIKGLDWTYNRYLYSYYKKIILTTDQDLIKDGVQAIDDEFLKWWIKNPSCERVEVVDDTYTVGEMSKLPLGTINHKYKIIPQEENEKDFYKIGNFHENCDEGCKYHCTKGNTQIAECLECHFNNTSKEQIENDWKEAGKQTEGINSPTVEEFLEAQTQFKKQETLEEAAENHHINFTKDLSYAETRRDSFIKGAEWQAKRMYSEEEVIEVLTQRCKEFGTKNEKFQKLLLKQDLEWFEQFKKK